MAYKMKISTTIMAEESWVLILSVKVLSIIPIIGLLVLLVKG